MASPQVGELHNLPGLWASCIVKAIDDPRLSATTGRKPLKATDRQIESMKQDVSPSGADTRKVHAKNFLELQATRKAAAAELERLKKSAANTWDATKSSLSKTYKELQDSYEKAAAAEKATQ